MAMACHYRVATHDAQVGQPEVLLGIIPGAGGTQRLPRLAGARLALDMCTQGKPLRGAEGARCRHHRSGGRRRSRAGLLRAAIAFAKARAKAVEMRRTRELPIRPEDVERRGRGLRCGACGPRQTTRGAAAAYAAVDAIQAALTLPVRRRLAARARALRGLCRLDRVEGAPAHVLRRARGREGPRHPEGHAGEGHRARRGRRRRHDGRRHRDDVRQRRHPGAAERGRRRGAAARAGDHPPELRRDDVEGQDDRGAGREDDGAHHADDVVRRLRSGGHRRRGGVREHGPEEGDVRRARGGDARRLRPRVEFVHARHRRARPRERPARRRCSAIISSAPPT